MGVVQSDTCRRDGLQEGSYGENIRRGDGLERTCEALCGYEEEDMVDVSQLVESLYIMPEALESISSTAQTRYGGTCL